jgi:hypothetical protein
LKNPGSSSASALISSSGWSMKITAALTVQPGLPTLPPTAVILPRIICVSVAVQSRGMPMTIGQTSSSKRASCSLSVGLMSFLSAWAISRRWPWTTTDSWDSGSAAVDARTPIWALAGAVAASKAALMVVVSTRVINPPRSSRVPPAKGSLG